MDVLKSKIMLSYSAFLFLITLVLLGLEENSSKAILSLLNILLIVVPLVSMIFSTIHYYNSYEFIEMLLCQPIGRKKVLLSEFFALSIALITALIIGLGVPLILFSSDTESLWLILTAIPFTVSCAALSMLVTVNVKDKAKGIGIVLLMWFYFSLIYDGIILLILFGFSDYPLEKITLALVALNPIDLARVSIMLKMDISALMGYTGALYRDFFGSLSGFLFTFGILFLWILIPIYLAVRTFRRRDL